MKPGGVFEVTKKAVEEALLRRRLLGGITLSEELILEDVLEIFGPPVVLWRRLDGERETVEVRLRLIAELICEGIPHNEPHTRAARIIRVPFARVDASSLPIV